MANERVEQFEDVAEAFGKKKVTANPKCQDVDLQHASRLYHSIYIVGMYN